VPVYVLVEAISLADVSYKILLMPKSDNFANPRLLSTRMLSGLMSLWIVFLSLCKCCRPCRMFHTKREIT